MSDLPVNQIMPEVANYLGNYVEKRSPFLVTKNTYS